MPDLTVGSRLVVSGGYDMDPEWLRGMGAVTGSVEAWLERPGGPAACVVRLDSPLTAAGDVHGRRESRTGDHLLLSPRYQGQGWDSDDRTVHVVLCEGRPAEDTFEAWFALGAWVESHATYERP